MAALTGMAEIAAYMRRSEATVLTWIRTLDFPARKIGGMWESDTELADQWRIKQVMGIGKETGVQQDGGAL